MPRYHPAIPLPRVRDLKLLRRFVAKVEVYDPTGCWMWTGSCDKRGGYPRLWSRGKNQRAHRLSYAMFVGPIPDDLTVDHTCRCTCCVNPMHLTLKTVSDNAKERHARQRQ